MRGWSRADLIGVIGAGFTLLGIVVSIALPESRRFLGLDPDGYNLIGKIFHTSSNSSAPPNPFPSVTPAFVPNPYEPTPNFGSETLVGTWVADEIEMGLPVRLFWQLQPDGASLFRSTSAKGINEVYSAWQYSNNMIFTTASNGSSAKGSIRWIDSNHFELTIIDNGIPAYTGLKRNYYRCSFWTTVCN